MSFQQPDFGTNSPAVRTLAGVGVATMVVGAAAVWYFDPATASFAPACPLYKTTGFACPGCGMTRGFHALFHGDILTALDFNALIPLIALFLGYILVSMFLVATRGRGLPFARWNLTLLWGSLALLVIFGILRNLPYYPFTILFP